MKLTKLLLIFIFSFVVFTACSSEGSSSQVSTTTSGEVIRDPSLPGQFLFSSSLPGEDHMVTEHIFVMIWVWRSPHVEINRIPKQR